MSTTVSTDYIANYVQALSQDSLLADTAEVQFSERILWPTSASPSTTIEPTAFPPTAAPSMMATPYPITFPISVTLRFAFLEGSSKVKPNDDDVHELLQETETFYTAQLLTDTLNVFSVQAVLVDTFFDASSIFSFQLDFDTEISIELYEQDPVPDKAEIVTAMEQADYEGE